MNRETFSKFIQEVILTLDYDVFKDHFGVDKDGQFCLDETEEDCWEIYQKYFNLEEVHSH